MTPAQIRELEAQVPHYLDIRKDCGIPTLDGCPPEWLERYAVALRRALKETPGPTVASSAALLRRRLDWRPSAGVCPVATAKRALRDALGVKRLGKGQYEAVAAHGQEQGWWNLTGDMSLMPERDACDACPVHPETGVQCEGEPGHRGAHHRTTGTRRDWWAGGEHGFVLGPDEAAPCEKSGPCATCDDALERTQEPLAAAAPTSDYAADIDTWWKQQAGREPKRFQVWRTVDGRPARMLWAGNIDQDAIRVARNHRPSVVYDSADPEPVFRTRTVKRKLKAGTVEVVVERGRWADRAKDKAEREQLKKLREAEDGTPVRELGMQPATAKKLAARLEGVSIVHTGRRSVVRRAA